MHFPLLLPEFKNEFNLRLEKVRQAMTASGTDALLGASTVNIFYLTGGICRGWFYIPLEGDPVFFYSAPAEIESPVACKIRKPEQIREILDDSGKMPGRNIGLEFDDLYYSDVLRLERVFEGCKHVNASVTFREARLTKTPFELKLIKEDGMRHCAVYSRIASCYSEDMTDLEFQIEIERILRQEGNLGYLRVAGSKMEINMGSLLAGPNADEPSPYDFSMGGAGTDPSLPVGASGIIMKPGMSVMVDMNGGFNGYQTDMTRCWTIGEPSSKALKAHECSRNILRAIEETAKPGTEISSLYALAREMAHAEGLGEYFMGHRHHVAFIGHGVGIELNEAPVIMERNRNPLQKGMVIALEPKFVLPGVGALGVENTYYVGEKGLENLTPFREELDAL